jgi:hypothetical protein
MPQIRLKYASNTPQIRLKYASYTYSKVKMKETVKCCNSDSFHAIWLKFFLAVALFAGLGILWIFLGSLVLCKAFSFYIAIEENSSKRKKIELKGKFK